MFQSARISLTAWYLLIIMCISLLFSAVIFHRVNSELIEFDIQQRIRQDRIDRMFGNFSISPRVPSYDPTIIDEARQRFILILAVINGAILAIAGGAGYFLAGKTLRPIREMVGEQQRFISDASHELRTPITALTSEIEVHLRDKNLTLPEAKELLKSNLEEVHNLERLTNNLLELSTYGTVSNASLFVSLNLSEIIQEAVKRVQRLATKKKMKMTTLVADISVRGIEVKLIELFVILLDNAIKYGDMGTEIQVFAKKRTRGVLIGITNTGVGIEKKDIPHIFERFYRSDNSRTKTNISGYGLGLSIAQKIVALHNGEIQVKSIPHKETTFTIFLPSF